MPNHWKLIFKDRFLLIKVKIIPQEAEVAQGVPGSLRPRIFLTFGTTRVVGRQPYAPAVFTPGEIPGTHFQGLSRPQGTRFRRREPRKKFPVTPPGIDAGTSRLVAECLNYYPIPDFLLRWAKYRLKVHKLKTFTTSHSKRENVASVWSGNLKIYDYIL